MMEKEVSLLIRELTLPSPLVSVVLMAGEETISPGDSLERILSQRTSFDTEVVIVDMGMDDASIDVCQEYKAVYPGRVGFYTRKGRYYPGKFEIPLRGNYVIFYREEENWSDRFKIQRLGEFLLMHSGYAACFYDTGNDKIPVDAGVYAWSDPGIKHLFRNKSPLLRLSLFPLHRHITLYERSRGEFLLNYISPGKIRCMENNSRSVEDTFDPVFFRLPFLRRSRERSFRPSESV